MAPQEQPIYRADIKGRVAETKAECVDIMRNQIAMAEEFIGLGEDLPAWDEYSVYLTETELKACFKQAVRATAAA
jgi:hypothetical protein